MNCTSINVHLIHPDHVPVIWLYLVVFVLLQFLSNWAVQWVGPSNLANAYDFLTQSTSYFGNHMQFTCIVDPKIFMYWDKEKKELYQTQIESRVINPFIHYRKDSKCKGLQKGGLESNDIE